MIYRTDSQTLKTQYAFGLAILVLALSGCEEYLPTSYGTFSDESVNGTEALISMFQQQGCEVFGRTRWSHRVADRADIIVWTPDAMPDEESRDYLESWLQGKSGRVVLYVGPDFDAAPQYWRSTLINVPLEYQARFRDELQDALILESRRHNNLPGNEDFTWFHLNNFLQGRPDIAGKPLTGDPDLTEDIKADEASLSIKSILDPGFDFDILLSVDSLPILFRRTLSTDFGDESSLYIATNGSFLFNLPLVNPEHRKLTKNLIEKLISAASNPESQSEKPSVCFLTAQSVQLEARDLDSPEANQEFPPKMLWLVLLQISILGVIFSFACWPILGKKRVLRREQETDFGRHIQAVGALLAEGNHGEYAQRTVSEYIRATRDESRQLRRKKK